MNTKSGVIDKDQQSIKNMNNKFQETVKLKKKAKSYQKGLYIHNERGERYLTGNF